MDLQIFFGKVGKKITLAIEPISCIKGPLKKTVVSVFYRNNGLINTWKKDDGIEVPISLLEKLKKMELNQIQYHGSTSYTCFEFIYNEQVRSSMIDGTLDPFSLLI